MFRQKTTVNLAKGMAIHLGLSQNLIDKIYTGGLCHDIGKVPEATQNYYKNHHFSELDDDFQGPGDGYPLYNEISWAYTAQKISDGQVTATHSGRQRKVTFPTGVRVERV